MSWRCLIVNLGCFLVLVSALASVASAGSAPTFVDGKLLDITSDERVIEGTAFRNAVYEVQIDNVIYFGKGERIKKSSGDPGHGLIIGDPVKAAVDGDNLILQRPDGKQIKTKIVRRVRAEAQK